MRGVAVFVAYLLVMQLSVGASRALASPLELYGYGGRSPALAGTGVASSSTFDSVYLNPAGLTYARARHVAVGFQGGNLRLKMEGHRTDTPNTSALTFGLVAPLEFGGAIADRLTLALGIQVPQNALVRADTRRIGDPVFAILESRSDIVGIQTALGIRIDERWAVGIGALSLGSLVGSIDVDVDAAGRFVSRGEQQIIADHALIAGVRYRHSDDLSAGLTFRDESGASYDFQVTSDLADSLPLGLPQLQILGVAQYDPLTVAAELALRPRPHLLLSMGLDYKRWSAFPLPTENPVIGGEPLPGADFHDTLVPRLGLESSAKLGATELYYRAGYSFVWSPAPEMTGPQSLLDNHRHVVAGGLGLAWPGTRYPFHLDAWTQVHVLQPRNNVKDPDRFEDPMDIPFDSVSTSGKIFVGGVLLGVDL